MFSLSHDRHTVVLDNLDHDRRSNALAGISLQLSMSGMCLPIASLQSKSDYFITKQVIPKATSARPASLVVAAGQVAEPHFGSHLCDRAAADGGDAVIMPPGFHQNRLQIISVRSVECLQDWVGHLDQATPKGKSNGHLPSYPISRLKLFLGSPVSVPLFGRMT